MWPSFLSSFLAGLAISICSGESLRQHRVVHGSGLEQGRTRGDQSTFSACCVSLFPQTLCLQKEGAAAPDSTLGPFRCSCWVSPPSHKSMPTATRPKQLKG